MSSLIEQIVREAKVIFSKDATDFDFTDKLNNLVKLVSKLQPSDVKLAESVKDMPGYVKRIFPCVYIEILSAETFLMSIYILKPGVTMPLHDLPKLGIMKVIEGSVRISAYTSVIYESKDKMVPEDVKDKIERSQRNYAVFKPVYKHEPKLMELKDQPLVLGSKGSVFREVSAVGDMAAFLDIISPPFDMDENKCKFYKVLETAEQDAVVKTWLVESPPDVHFYNTRIPYCGPEIKL